MSRNSIFSRGVSRYRENMDLELHQLERRYEKLRRRDTRKEHQLVASLAGKGQLLPVVVVRDPRDAYVLVDGYKRVRALARLRHDRVSATVWDLAEPDALLLERLMRSSGSENPLEQGWLLEELNERFGLSHEELARRFDKSQSWVSRRLALVRVLPRQVQERVRCGVLPAHAAMKFLVPMARAKRADCVRLVAALSKSTPSTRDVGALYRAWAGGNAETRELVVTQPTVVLRAQQQAKQDAHRAPSPAHKLSGDLNILVDTCRRARGRIAQGLFDELLPVEQRDVRRLARRARTESEALFRETAFAASQDQAVIAKTGPQPCSMNTSESPSSN